MIGNRQSETSILLYRRCNSLCFFFFKKRDSYKLTIIASDLNGQAGGNTGTGEVEVKILDINDNVPFLEKESVGT